MPFIIPANTLASGGFDVDNSGRFNIGSSDHLTRSLGGSPTSTRKATWSYWVKRSTLTSSASEMIYSNEVADDNNRGFIQFEDNDSFRMTDSVSSTQLKTNRLFRDVASFYHIVLAIDTTQGTAANRIKLYVNGVQETSFATASYPDQNDDLKILTGGQTNKQHISKVHGGSGYFGGYLSEFVFIDGLQLAPTSFGEFDEDSGIWVPIDVSGLTFGTNGFYLDFEDSSALGNDANGGTDFTVNNLTALDQSLDTCSNNFNTYSPLWGMQAIRVPTFEEGNLKITGDGDAQHHQVMGTFAVNKGKWYWEAKFTVSADIGKNKVGIMSVDLGSPQTAEIVDQSGSCVFVNEDGGDFRRDNATVDQNSGVFTQNQIIGVALNMDDGEISIYRDNSLIVDALDIGNADGTYVTPASVHYRDAGMEFNFGSAPYALTSAAADGDGFGAFEFAPPSGYFALCSKNLAEYG